MYNRDKLFASIRGELFPRFTQEQVDGINNILDYEDKNPFKDTRHFAYLLATVYWETAKTMQPITEYGSQAYLRAKKYWPWIGRGLVQITWEENYKKFGLTNPEDALVWENALHIAWKGMIEGIFTGKKLSHYFNDKTDDPLNARRIINGTDKRKEIAAIHNKFLTALKLSKEETNDTSSIGPRACS